MERGREIAHPLKEPDLGRIMKLRIELARVARLVLTHWVRGARVRPPNPRVFLYKDTGILQSEESKPPCPLCRRPLIFSAETERHSKGHRPSDLCQMEGCDRKLDFYCNRCDHFVCFRCNKRSKCGDFPSHIGQDVEESLLPLARQQFTEWKDKIEKRINQLRNEVSKLAPKLSELTKADANFSRDKARETLKLTQKLHSLSVHAAAEHEELYYYQDLDKKDEQDLIRFLLALSIEETYCESKDTLNQTQKADELNDFKKIEKKSMESGHKSKAEAISVESGDEQNQTLKTKEINELNKIERASLDSDDMSKDNDFEFGAKPKLPGGGKRSGSDMLLNEDLHDSSSKGYLPLIVQVHRSVGSQQCRYTRSERAVTISGSYGKFTPASYCWNLLCYCKAYPRQFETHYSKACKWTRVADEVSGCIYYIRKCRCIRPPQA
ncbi:uncharacterized protein [Watersipora subatra]|uniref:uncharacterized protein n=1 Tax=Watersipora subatra TaxID=2589382 RepID=UPI00355C1018